MGRFLCGGGSHGAEPAEGGDRCQLDSRVRIVQGCNERGDGLLPALVDMMAREEPHGGMGVPHVHKPVAFSGG